MIMQIMEDSNLDKNLVIIDIQKVYLLFEKNCYNEPIISVFCCSLMNQMLHQDPQ